MEELNKYELDYICNLIEREILDLRLCKTTFNKLDMLTALRDKLRKQIKMKEMFEND